MKPAALPFQRHAAARLLVVDGPGRMAHLPRNRLDRALRPGDLLVANDAATLPASLGGIHERSGEPLEVRLAGRSSLARDDVGTFTAIVFGSGDHRTPTEERPPPPPLRPNDSLALGPLRARVVRTLGHPRLVELELAGSPDRIWSGIARHGRPIQYAHVPPPLALWDVWTPVAAVPVAFEAPSAGYAVDWSLLGRLAAGGVGFETLTLASGISSTGDPALDARLPFDEAYHIPDATVRGIEKARKRGGRVIALGTTVTRALEHAARAGVEGWIPVPGPGVADQRVGRHSPVRVVDAVVTGVHEPGESHYELLRAFACDRVLARMHRELERAGYRSHEFGDSVLVERGLVAAIGPGSSRTGARRGQLGGVLPPRGEAPSPRAGRPGRAAPSPGHGEGSGRAASGRSFSAPVGA